MKSKQSIVFDKIRTLYHPHFEKSFCLDFGQIKIRASQISPEQFHILANAVNKFYELVAIND